MFRKLKLARFHNRLVYLVVVVVVVLLLLLDDVVAALEDVLVQDAGSVADDVDAPANVYGSLCWFSNCWFRRRSSVETMVNLINILQS